MTIIEKIKKRKKLFIFLAFLLSWQSLTLSGFCYSDMRWLNENELIDAVLFGEDHENLSFEEKVEIAAEQGIDYPGCCSVEKTNFIGWTAFDVFGYSLFLNRYYFTVHKYHYREGKEEPYHWWEEGVNACGTRTFTGFGGGVTESSYDIRTKRNEKRYWENAK